jgi:2-aminoadipate transaminase
LKSNDPKEALRRIWQERDLKEIAGKAAKTRINTSSEWASPEGIQPRKELLFLSVGIPDTGSLPRKALNEAMEYVLRQEDDAGLRYGFGPGYYPIRKYLAETYSKRNRFEVSEDWFQLCNGSSGAIDLVVRSIIDPGDVIIAESPSYMGSLGNFIGVGAEVCSISMDEFGMDIKELEQKLRALKKKGKQAKLVYTISTFQNPTGVSMSRERKEELLHLAAREGFIVLEDTAYEDLYYDTPDSDTMSSLSNGYGVITVGTFSKIVATGLRIGWVHARPEFIRLFGRMRFDMGQNQMALRMMGRFLELGNLEPHLTQIRALYKNKMNFTADAIEQQMKNYVSFTRPRGGFYLWVKLAEGLSAKDVWRTATQEGVAVNPGYSFFPDIQSRNGEYLRIAYSWAPMDRLEEAVKRLATAFQRVANGDVA